ncbi:hypothetical protein RJT34_08001 [Clitoria ternatea]|uniref:Uncharacterized protein n=1 Tax=Clitoria ternatea TaxID=43366 RepID=A0AAN9K5N2_CLITE
MLGLPSIDQGCSIGLTGVISIEIHTFIISKEAIRPIPYPFLITKLLRGNRVRFPCLEFDIDLVKAFLLPLVTCHYYERHCVPAPLLGDKCLAPPPRCHAPPPPYRDGPSAVTGLHDANYSVSLCDGHTDSILTKEVLLYIVLGLRSSFLCFRRVESHKGKMGSEDRMMVGQKQHVEDEQDDDEH